MPMAIVHHATKFFPHAVLTLNTDIGVIVLDNLSNAPLCWRDAPYAPYAFERREGPRALWKRFVR